METRGDVDELLRKCGYEPEWHSEVALAKIVFKHRPKYWASQRILVAIIPVEDRLLISAFNLDAPFVRAPYSQPVNELKSLLREGLSRRSVSALA
jgi:hypothetical protein